MSDTAVRGAGAATEGAGGPGTDAPGMAAVTGRASAWLAVGAAVLALVLAPPVPGDGLPAGIYGTVLDGELEQQVDGGWRRATAGDLVAEGVPVRVPDGPVRLATRDGTVSLGDGSEAELATGDIALSRGAVLVEGDRTTTVTSGSIEARGRGTWRLDANAAPRVAVYRGGAAVAGAAGGEATIGPLRQVDIVEDAVGGGPVALRYLPVDPWDARLLADAIAVDQQVEQLVRSLTARYGSALQPDGFYADFAAVEGVVADALPELARLRDGDRYGPAAETLVAVVVVELIRDRSGLPTTEVVAEVGAFRAVGATWGLVLASRDLGPADLRAATDEALRRRQEQVDEGTATPVVPDSPPDADTDDAPPEEQPPVGSPPDEDPGDDDPPGDDPPSDDPTDDIGGQADDLADDTGEQADDALDDVADLLEPVPGASEPVDELGDMVEDTADGAGDTVEDTLP